MFRDLVGCAIEHAERHGDRACATIVSRRTPEQSRTFAEIATAAGRAAAWYRQAGLSRGDVVLFLGTHHIDLYAAWLGCLWCGGVPAILAEPSVRVDRGVYWSRLNELVQRIDAWGLAVDPRVRKQEPALPAARRVVDYPEIATGTDASPPAPLRPGPDDVMLLQHSSGTTGLQKGVMLTHGAVWRHAESYHTVLRPTERDVVASWLPLYHDMGFIACFVDALLLGLPVAWLSPFEWVANPALLLEAITRHRATLCWLPNFALPFLAQRVKPAPGKYDLSSLRAVVNCSEPVSADAMRTFAERFASDGLNPAALQTCYAMAENVFAVTTSTDDAPPRTRTLDRRAWVETHRAVDAVPAAPTIQLLSSGRPVPGVEVRIADASGKPQPVDVAGSIRIRSPFLFAGYYRRDDLNAGLFDGDGFYDTGDTGFLDAAGQLYVTGRTKDIVIVGGKNVYPHDVEAAATVAGIKPGRVVCFGVHLRDLDTEGLVVLCESDEPETMWADLARSAAAAVPAQLDVDAADVRIVPTGVLRKSTSGKPARDGNRQWYLEGRFGPVPHNIDVEGSS